MTEPMPRCPRCQATFPEGTIRCPTDGALLSHTMELADTMSAAPQAASQRSPVPEKDELVGVLIDQRLRVLRRLGEGGMGTVYAAEHVGIGKEVALKILRKKHTGDANVAERLRIEARHASAIKNEHIVDIFDIGETKEGRTFVVMELLGGESLAQRLARCGPLPESEVIEIGVQLARALSAAHRGGIIHRDIKPENIFLCSRNQRDFVKILDFGISKALRGTEHFEPRLTHTGMIMGTPLYMSPEQARGEEELDHRIDIYSLGVVLYECLTGDVPFRATNYLGIISKIQTEDPVPPTRRRAEGTISLAMERVVLRAMAKKREDRYPSMAALLEDLERVSEQPDEPLRAAGAGSGMAGRRRALRLALLGGGALLSAGIVIAALAPEPRSPAAALAPLHAPVAAPVPGTPDLGLRAPTPDLGGRESEMASRESRSEGTALVPARPAPPPVRPGRRRQSGAGLEITQEEQAPNPFRRRPQK